MEGCRRINVLIGPPNVGKSNILEALSLFSVASKNYHSDKDATKLLRMARLPHLFFNGDIRNPIKITLDNYLLYGNYTSRAEYSIGKSNYQREEGVSIRCSDNDIEDYEYLFRYGIDPDLQLSNITFTPGKWEDLRDLTPRNIVKYNFDKEKTGKRDDVYLTLTSPFGDNVYSFIFYSDNAYLKDDFKKLLVTNNLLFSFNQGTQQVELLKIIEGGKHFTIPPSLIADTIQRLIFYKAAIMGNTNSILLFEEPEAHCYESYIIDFTNDIKFDLNNNQFFIVTHSLYVLQEFIRERDTRKEVNLFLVGSENGETVIKKMDDSSMNELFESGMDIFLNYESIWNETLTA